MYLEVSVALCGRGRSAVGAGAVERFEGSFADAHVEAEPVGVKKPGNGFTDLNECGEHRIGETSQAWKCARADVVEEGASVDSSGCTEGL